MTTADRLHLGICLLLLSFKLSYSWVLLPFENRIPNGSARLLERLERTSRSPLSACNTDHDEQQQVTISETSRRNILQCCGLATMLLVSRPQFAFSAEEGMLSATTVADRLRVVPTFAIVDTKGVPYMVVGEDAKVTGYFFTTYGEARRLLDLAKTSADKALKEAVLELRAKRRAEKLPPLSKAQEDDEVGINPWKQARISTVTLDNAVTMVTKSLYSKRTGGGNYFQVAPAESDIEDALALDKSGKDELAEGRVPLFYVADFEITTKDGTKENPLYFRKSELLEDWKRQNPSGQVPEVLVTELFNVLTEMVKPGGTDEDIKTLVFVPPKESAQKAKECNRAGGKEAPFLVGQRIVVL